MRTLNIRLSFILAAVSILYLVLFFPLAYFRHDDWLIIGNGVLHLPEDWSFAFRPTLFIDNIEQVWFFRPFFKITAYLFHHWFGYHYYLWLLTILGCTLGAVVFGYSSLKLLTVSENHGLAFLILFLGSLYFHFGSVVWAGEGLMNCPMLFLLMVNLYFFIYNLVKEDGRPSTFRSLLAITAFTLALGFKEAAVFHSGFLFCILFFEARFSHLCLKEKGMIFLPYFILSSLYLYYRLGVLPVNVGYIPKFTLEILAFSLPYMLGAFVLPLLAAVAALILTEKRIGTKALQGFKKKFLLAPLFLVFCLPYIGHPFFSPGWFIVPGLYFSLSLVLFFWKSSFSEKTLKYMALFIVLSSSAVTFWKLQDLGWWYWHQPQKQMFEILRSQDPHVVKKILISHCPNPKFPKASLDSVVASNHGIEGIWKLLHGTEVSVESLPCHDTTRFPRSHVPSERTVSSSSVEDTLFLDWRFPQVAVVQKQ